LLKRIFPLILCVCCAFLFAACSSSDTTSNNSTATTNKTTTNATTTASPAATTTTASTSGEKIGVPECDDYLAKYEACVSGKIPEAARSQYNSSLDQTRKSWRALAANPQTKAALAQTCKAATESARQSMKSFGCDF
jgi:hypothetical protein